MSLGALARTGPAPGADGPPTRRRWTGVLLAVLVVAGTVLVAYEPPSTGRAFDPSSRAPGGLAVLVDVLAALDVDVTVADALPRAGATEVVVAPPLGWPAAELEELAVAGARVVAVVPPAEDAELVTTSVGTVGLVTRPVACDLLAGVGSLRSPTWRAWEVPADAAVPDERCVVDGDAAWATVVPTGAGETVALGTFAPLVNDRMRDEDAAVAAVRLLAVAPGDRVVALTVPDARASDPSLADLVDPRWFDAAWLTLLVLVLAAAARGRRLGRPVAEELPVRVPSGELARATGDLRHRAGAHAAALEELRRRTLALVGGRLGLGSTPTGDEAVDALADAGIALSSEQVDAVRSAPDPALDGSGLTTRAAALAAVRAAVHRGPPTGPPGTPGDHPHATSQRPERP